MAKIALIAGRGDLPYYWARSASRRDERTYIFKIAEEDTRPLIEYAEEVFEISLGNFDRLIEVLLEYDIKKVVFAGKVEKNNLFQLEFDQRMKKILAGLKDYNDDTILKAIAAEFVSEGIEVLPQSDELKDLLVRSGRLTDTAINQKLLSDMEFAFSNALEIGRLDIGQTVLVKDKTVIAVEAAEGTDKAILRAGRLAGSGLVMAKVCKEGQDFRFDIPTVGPETIKNLKKIDAAGIILEADKTFILHKEKFLREAKKAGIAVLAAKHGPGGIRWER